MEEKCLSDMIAALSALPRSAFWGEAFRRCASSRKLCRKRAEELGEAADAAGAFYARGLKARFESVGIEGLCAENRIEICELDMPQGGGTEIFALFEAPRTIYIRRDLLAASDEYIMQNGLKTALGEFKCANTVLAHEFFHFIEYKYEETIFTMTHREATGPLRVKKRLQALSEIAAMAFSAELNGLLWSPFVLDCVMLGMKNERAALNLSRRLLEDAAD